MLPLIAFANASAGEKPDSQQAIDQSAWAKESPSGLSPEEAALISMAGGSLECNSSGCTEMRCDNNDALEMPTIGLYAPLFQKPDTTKMATEKRHIKKKKTTKHSSKTSNKRAMKAENVSLK